MKFKPRKNSSSGFALTVTLSLMMLLTALTGELLALSSISLRTSSQSTEMATASVRGVGTGASVADFGITVGFLVLNLARVMPTFWTDAFRHCGNLLIASCTVT